MTLPRRSFLAALPLVLLALMLAAPLLPLADPLQMTTAARFAAPSSGFPLGRDEYGRDVLARILFAMRNSLAIATATALIAGIVGTALGILGGYLRGFAEVLTARFMDLLLCFPPLLLAMLAVTLYGPGVATLVAVLAVVFVPSFTRVAHAGVLSVRAQDFVEATRGMGAGPVRIMLRTILPNVAGPLVVQFSFVTAMTVVLESGLSFLGLGVLPPEPSLGLMIGTGRATLAQAPMLLVWPCLALVAMILVLNALCDGLRDRLDPRHATAREA